MYIRTTRPGKGDKYYIRKVSGGYSTCVKGKPTDKDCDALANCVGYCDGGYNEELDLGYEKYHLNCNAENFIERAIASGLSVVQDPVVGGIMVWQKGATLTGKDGAGHVCMCTSKPDKDTAKTAESSYGGQVFFTATRKRGSANNWGAGSGYKYRGCIVPVGYQPEPTPTPTPEPVPPSAKFAVGDRVVINGKLYKSSNAANASGSVSNRRTNITRYAAGAKHPYNTTGDLGWMDESSIQAYTESSSDVIMYTVQKGDNLSRIAKRYHTTWQKIYNDNRDVIGSNPNLIRPGMVLEIK